MLITTPKSKVRNELILTLPLHRDDYHPRHCGNAGGLAALMNCSDYVLHNILSRQV
jgi:hypothetical protein